MFLVLKGNNTLTSIQTCFKYKDLFYKVLHVIRLFGELIFLPELNLKLY